LASTAVLLDLNKGQHKGKSASRKCQTHRRKCFFRPSLSISAVVARSIILTGLGSIYLLER
jgi:hypothetical protein